MKKIDLRKSSVIILVAVVFVGPVMTTTGVSAQSVDGTVAVSPTELSLEQGESQTVAITYERESDATPQGIEYILEYDPTVISITNQDQGAYLGGTNFANNISNTGKVEYAEAIFDGSGVETANGTVATITVETASDVDDGVTTPLKFTTAKASEGSTEFTITTTNGTVEADVPNQADDPTDNDSDSEETTDEDSDSEETTDEDSDSEETTGGNTDTEETSDDTENDSNRTEEVDNSTTENENRTEAELNETVDTETSSSTSSEQPANDNSTGDGTPSENDTSGAIPGFGVKLTLIAVLAISYIIGRKSY